MYWVIQKNIFKPENYRLLTNALDSLGIKYISVSIPTGTLDLVPDVEVEGNVYVCGAIKLGKIAQSKDWQPGSFLNEEFRYDRWLTELGSELLNHDVVTGTLSNIDVTHFDQFFIRPLEDNKAFDGVVIDNEMLGTWRKDQSKSGICNLAVMASSVKEIFREYRLFIVNQKFVTGSVYKIGGVPTVSSDIEDGVINYAHSVIKKWCPSESHVIDIALTEKGYKVIEFNNINSSGFYGSNVPKYVEAIQSAYDIAR